MKRSGFRPGRRSALLSAALLAASASAASDLVDVRAVSGAPQVAVSAGRALVWRNVGVVAESDLVDVEAKIAACSSGAAPIATGFQGSAAATCPAAIASGVGTAPGHQFAATLKVPRWDENAPLVDVSVRSWGSAMRTGVGRDSATGSAAVMTVTHLVGPFDAFYGYSTPFGSAGAQERWRSAFAGVGWRTTTGTTIGFVADRGREAATGQVDRTFTLRFVLPVAARGLRFGAYATYALDDPAGAPRAGIGVDYAF